MPPICSNIFRPIFRPLCRYAHLNGTPGIYNTVPNWKPGPGWRPQSPQGPYLDGWAMGVNFLKIFSFHFFNFSIGIILDHTIFHYFLLRRQSTSLLHFGFHFCILLKNIFF